MIYDKKSKNDYKFDNTTINLNSIGFKNERNKSNSSNINYNRLNLLDKNIRIEAFSRLKLNIINETLRFIENLNLSYNFKTNIIIFSEKAYYLFKKNNYLYRSSTYTVPMSIYLICQKNYIFLNLKKLLSLIDYSKEILFKVIKNYLRIDISLFRLLHSEIHRKKKIINFCYGFIIENKLNISLQEIINYLDDYWNIIKNIKDILISAIVIKLISENYSFTKKIFSIVILCNYFGFQYSSFRNNYKKLMHDKNFNFNKN